jgi:hypothetical protein
MTTVLVLLLVNGALGAFDTLWYHEYRARLAWQPEQHRTELALHAGRDAIYCGLYGTIGWFAWNGVLAVLLGCALVAEIVITMCDFVVEDRTRRLRAGERVLHSAMAIIYGAMIITLWSQWTKWLAQPTGWERHRDVPTMLAVIATAAGIGIALSGIRDAIAALQPTGRGQGRLVNE